MVIQYLDVPVSLSDDNNEELWLLEMIDEIRVQRVEVVLNAGTLHD